MTATRWTGRGDGVSWSDPANWSAGVPVAGTDAAFGAGPKLTVNLSGRAHPLTAGALNVKAETLVLAQGVLNLAPTPAETGNTDDLVLSNKAALTIAATARVFGSNVAEIGNGTGATLTVLGVISEEYGVVRSGTLNVSGPTGHWISGDSGLYLQDSTLLVSAGAHVDAGGKLDQYPAAALDLDGNSTGRVTGCGSSLRLQNVFVSQGYGTSTLTVDSGGSLYTGGGDIGDNGDGTLTVTGAGSLFVASRGLRVGGQVPVNSKMVVEHGGTARIGQFGLVLDGTLALDGSATFVSPSILSGGGTIEALAGRVVLSSALILSDNDSDPYETGTTYLTAAQGSTLILKGAVSSVIPGDASVKLQAGSGHIVLAHADSGFVGQTLIYDATLEIAADAAAGTGGLKFVGGSNPAVLQIDRGVAFQNAISGFGKADEIDLAGFAYGAAALKSDWTPNAAGGTLTLTNSVTHQHQMLSFADTGLSAKSFALMSDGHGGTALFHT